MECVLNRIPWSLLAIWIEVKQNEAGQDTMKNWSVYKWSFTPHLHSMWLLSSTCMDSVHPAMLIGNLSGNVLIVDGEKQWYSFEGALLYSSFPVESPWKQVVLSILELVTKVLFWLPHLKHWQWWKPYYYYFAHKHVWQIMMTHDDCWHSHCITLSHLHTAKARPAW